jgi:adenylate cyclase
MNVTFKSFLLSAVKSLLFWALAFLLFIAIRYNDLEEEMSIYTDEEFFLPSNYWYLYAIFLGIIIGIFYAIIEFLFDSYLNKRIVIELNSVI